MGLELVVNVWLALLLKDQGQKGQYQAIIILFFVPSVINALVWMKLAKRYKGIGYIFMLALVFFGCPSPILVYVNSLLGN